MWTRSSRCDAGHCLEAARDLQGGVVIRNTSSQDSEPIWFSANNWDMFLDVVEEEEQAWKWFRDQDDITYTDEEAKAFKAFRAGVLAGEFEFEKLPYIDQH